MDLKLQQMLKVDPKII